MKEDKPGGQAPKPRIMVLHDSRIMRASITRHLKNDFDCLEVGDFEAGWRNLLEDATIEVVLADLGLPLESGVQFLGRVQSSDVPRVAHTPVIMIVSEDGHTSNALEEARQHALAAGALDFIGKGTTGAEFRGRIHGARRLREARLQVEENRLATAMQLPVDPATGLMTYEYCQVAGQQLVAHALRERSELAVLAVGIDGLAEIDARYGVTLSPVMSRELAVVLARALRREDTVVAIETGRFLALVPGVAQAEIAEMAGALQDRLAAVVMRYQDDIIQITASVGAASLLGDDVSALEPLVERAKARLLEASAAGLGQFVPAPAIAPAAPIDTPATPVEPAHPGSIDDALRLLAEKNASAIKPDLGRITLKLLPLLRVIEREFQLNFRLSRLKERASSAREALTEN